MKEVKGNNVEVIAALVFSLVGLVFAYIGTNALIQAWVWTFPLILLMILGAIGLFIAWLCMIAFTIVSISAIKDNCSK